MSDQPVREALHALQAWLDDPSGALDEATLQGLNHTLREALGAAEKGSDWRDLVAQAQVLAGRVAERLGAAEAQRDAIRAELTQQAQGDRALKGYGANTR